jgi:hypothetical protein
VGTGAARGKVLEFRIASIGISDMSSSKSTASSSARPPKLPIGVSDFDKLIREDYTFVDKTLMIRDIIEDGATVNLITRPRRFGKTLNLSMLHHFFAREVRGRPTAPELFEGLAVSTDAASMAHQGQYPIIFFTFKDIKESSFDDAVAKLRANLAGLYLEYPELLDSPHLADEQKAKVAAIRAEKANTTDLADAIKRLSHYLYLHYQKPVLLLFDEYDTPIHAAYTGGYYQKMVDFMRGLLGGGLKDNSYLYKAVITGILRVSRESLFSGLNNLKVHTVLDDRYSQYFGFTEEEVAGLFTTAGLAEQQTTREAPAAIKTWYNGYRFGGSTVYNPWSIISCLDEQGACRPYWINTSDNALLKGLLARADEDVKQQIEELLQGRPIGQLIDPNVVFGDLDKDGMALWSLLLFSGYLTATDPQYDRQGRVRCQLRIPNLEVLGLYERHVEEWFTDTMGLKGYSDFLNCLVTGKLEEFEARLSDYLLEAGSYFDGGQLHPEKFYHGLVLGLITGLKETHTIHSNRESGYGRYDVVVLPKGLKPQGSQQRPGILMEFKSAKRPEQLATAAQEALQQIERQRYQTELEQHGVTQVIKIGLAFCGKQLAISHVA